MVLQKKTLKKADFDRYNDLLRKIMETRARVFFGQYQFLKPFQSHLKNLLIEWEGYITDEEYNNINSCFEQFNKHFNKAELIRNKNNYVSPSYERALNQLVKVDRFFKRMAGKTEFEVVSEDKKKSLFEKITQKKESENKDE